MNRDLNEVRSTPHRYLEEKNSQAERTANAKILKLWGNSKEASVARAELSKGWGGMVVRHEIRQLMEGQITQGLVGHCKDFGF